jgi:hypothetical protein
MCISIFSIVPFVQSICLTTPFPDARSNPNTTTGDGRANVDTVYSTAIFDLAAECGLDHPTS